MDEASNLGDDPDEPSFANRFGGTLQFSDQNGTGITGTPGGIGEQAETTSAKIRSWSRCSQSSNEVVTSPKRGAQRVTFEIISARTANSGRKKFVNYTVLVKRAPGLECKPGVLERRYSDFLNLFQSLKKCYPSLLCEFPFPRKALLGNFTADVITERSVAFQHLLAYVFSVRELRQSSDLAEFFFSREMREAHHLMKAAQFEDAAIIFENAFFVQEKVLGEEHVQTYTTVCTLVACLNAVDNIGEAQKYGEVALQHSRRHEQCELTVPLLVLCIRLWWAMGKDKRELEYQVQDLRAKGTNVEKLPTLLELVLQRELPSE